MLVLLLKFLERVTEIVFDLADLNALEVFLKVVVGHPEDSVILSIDELAVLLGPSDRSLNFVSPQLRLIGPRSCGGRLVFTPRIAQLHEGDILACGFYLFDSNEAVGVLVCEARLIVLLLQFLSVLHDCSAHHVVLLVPFSEFVRLNIIDWFAK